MTRPVACMWAYMIVLPTNLKPRCWSALLSASDSGLVGGHLLDRRGLVDDRLATDEGPEVFRKAAELVLHREHAARVGDRGLDLEPVADDSRELHQPLDRALVEARDALGVEIRERFAIARPLVQDRRPGEARLRALEDQELELRAVVVHGDAPLLVVIADVGLVQAGVRPGATGAAVVQAKDFHSLRAQGGDEFEKLESVAPADRDRHWPNQPRSIGLRTPSPPRFNTCV